MITNLEYKHLAIYAESDITLTLIRSYFGGEKIQFIPNQRFDNICFFHGFQTLHSEPYSVQESINRYYLELYPLSVFENLYPTAFIERFNCSLENMIETWKFINREITLEQVSYSTYKMLVKNKIDFLNFIGSGIAVDINKKMDAINKQR